MAEKRYDSGLDKDGYPTEAALKAIEEWVVFDDSVRELLDYIESIWSDYGDFRLKGKRVLRLELITGGWSGNESIIEALQSNFMFWTMYWMESHRGGLYRFRIRWPRK